MAQHARSNGQRSNRNRRPRLFYGDSQDFNPRRPVSTLVMRRRNSIRDASQLSLNDVINENDMEIVDHDNNVARNQRDNVRIEGRNDALPPNVVLMIDNQIVQSQEMDVLMPLVNDQNIVNNVVQLGVNMIEESINMHNDLVLAASGTVPNILLSNQPSIINSMNTFI